MMTMAEIIGKAAGFFAGSTFVFGIVAGILWYRSANTRLTPSQVAAFLSEPAKHAELAAWLITGADLNRWAAIWTLLSVMSGALCTALDHMR